MAGGPNAEAAPCLHCAERADRVSEGLETDYFLCSACGSKFGIDFDAAGPPDAPMWPPTAEEKAELLKKATRFGFGPDR
jgi:hypothetical protein